MTFIVVIVQGDEEDVTGPAENIIHLDYIYTPKGTCA